ncbi:MAG: hypothetical protein C0615_06615 [Desulfuromonas sp.]|nr:MAG: hypothetical protein C0615_06615 [Desulfuromonas sp.]
MKEKAQTKNRDSKRSRYIRLCIVLAVIGSLNVLGTWIGHQINFQLFPRHDLMLHTLVMIAISLYILLMATPFMPGIEVGMAVMLVLGHKSALLIYLSTIIALSISYVVGRYFPLKILHKFLNWLYLNKASELVSQLEPLGQKDRLGLLNDKAPKKIAPFLLKHRYLTLAVVLNLPGNALVGGGGGIGLVVGMSRVVPFYKYLLVVVFSVLPVPLCIYLKGYLE